VKNLSDNQDYTEAVVFIHGIWGTPANFMPLAARLSFEEYDPHLFSYNSVTKTPKENAEKLNIFIDRIQADIIHLVAHSLGGIVLKHLMHNHSPDRIGKTLMLATPINGSEVAKDLNKNDMTKLVLGRATEHGLLGDAPPWPNGRPLGMVAGDKDVGVGKIFKKGGLEGPNDGVVKLSETMSDEITYRYEVSYSHTAMLLTNELAISVLCYLRDGNFEAMSNPDMERPGRKITPQAVNEMLKKRFGR